MKSKRVQLVSLALAFALGGLCGRLACRPASELDGIRSFIEKIERQKSDESTPRLEWQQ